MSDPDQRTEQLKQVIGECRRRLQAGELDDSAVLVEFPGLLPELKGELKKLRLVHKARVLSEQRAALASGPQSTSAAPDQAATEKAEDISITVSIAAATAGTQRLSPNQPPPPSGTPAKTPPKVRFFGDYELLEELGRGGMGVVYKAQQLSLNRTVAVKMLLAGTMASEEEVRRFYAEAEAAAKLEHPHIVPVYDVGEHNGTHYFCMAYIRGRSLHDILREQPLPAKQAAEFLAKVAAAIAYAHEQGVLHRDLKPHNILVDEHNEPRVTDFGLAKRTGADADMTATGQIIGTPSYMPPEQALADRDRIGPRSDVYSLGATLYACITGRPPFQAVKVAQVIVQVLNQEPVSPRTLIPQLDRDIETIALHAMQKAPERRYATAADFERDLTRYLRGEPIVARPVGSLGRLFKWGRRNRAIAALLAIVFVTLAGGASVATYFAVQRDFQAAQAQFQLKRANQKEAEERAARQAAETATLQAEARHYQLILKDSLAAVRDNNWDRLATILYDAPPRMTGWETRYLQRQMLQGPQLTGELPGNQWAVISAALSPDGQRVATVGADGKLLVFRLVDGAVDQVLDKGLFVESERRSFHLAVLKKLEVPVEDMWLAAVWSPTGNEVIAVSISGRCAAFDIATGTERQLGQADSPLSVVAVAPDGRIASGGEAGRLFVFPESQDEPSISIQLGESTLTAVVWHDPSKHWLVGDAEGNLYAVDEQAEDQQKLATHAGPIWQLARQSAERDDWLLVACGEAAIPCYRLTPSPLQLTLVKQLQSPTVEPPIKGYLAIAFSRQGTQLFAIDDQGRGQLFDWPGGRMLVNWQATPHDRAIPELDQIAQTEQLVPLLRHSVLAGTTPDDDSLISSGIGRSVRLWSLKSLRSHEPLRVGSDPILAFDAKTPSLLWTVDNTGEIRVIDVLSRQEVARHAANAGSIRALVASQRGVCSAGDDGKVLEWQFEDGRIKLAATVVAGGAAIEQLDVSADGRWFAAQDAAGQLKVWNRDQPGEPRELSQVASLAGEVGKFAFDRTGSRLAVMGPSQSSEIFHLPEFRREERYRPQIAGSGGLAWIWPAHDDELLYAVDDFGRFPGISFAGKSAEMEAKPKLNGKLIAAAVDPRGERWFLLDESSQISVFDPQFVGETWVLKTELTEPCGLALDASGTQLVAAGRAGELRIFAGGVPPREPTLPLVEGPLWITKRLCEYDQDVRLGNTYNLIALDQEDRVHALLMVSAEQQQLGQITWVRERPPGGCDRELIVTTTYDQYNCLALDFTPRAEPVVVYRESSRQKGSYSGRVSVARRDEPSGRWLSQVIRSQGNVGFWPVVLGVDDEGISDLAYFDYNAMRWERSRRDPRGWQTTLIGEPGDGAVASGRRHADGSATLFSQCKHGQLNFSPYVHLRISGDEEQRNWFPLLAGRVVKTAVASDGTPWGMLTAQDALGRTKLALVHRRDQEWIREPLPLGSAVSEDLSFGLDPQGQPWVLDHQRSQPRVILWRQSKGAWRRQVILEVDPTAKLVALDLRFDSQLAPVLIYAAQLQGQFQLNVARPGPAADK